MAERKSILSSNIKLTGDQLYRGGVTIFTSGLLHQAHDGILYLGNISCCKKQVKAELMRVSLQNSILRKELIQSIYREIFKHFIFFSFLFIGCRVWEREPSFEQCDHFNLVDHSCVELGKHKLRQVWFRNSTLTNQLKLFFMTYFCGAKLYQPFTLLIIVQVTWSRFAHIHSCFQCSGIKKEQDAKLCKLHQTRTFQSTKGILFIDFIQDISSIFHLIISNQDQEQDSDTFSSFVLGFDHPQPTAFTADHLANFINQVKKHPVTTKAESRALLQKYFLASRRIGQDIPQSGMVILIRLSEVHARLSMRQEVVIEDAVFACHFYEECLAGLIQFNIYSMQYWS